MTVHRSSSFSSVILQVPGLCFWIWLTLLVEVVDNQRLPSSVLEDAINKPWRPLPARRLSPSGARRFLLFLVPCVALISCYLGSLEESVALMVLTWMYNDLGGADEGYFVRNLLNACGLTCFSAGALKIAVGDNQLNERAYIWLGLLICVMLTSIQTQDMADMEGDAARGRRTIPLVHGEWAARLSIATAVASWSVVCPLFWHLSPASYVAPVFVGGALTFRILFLRNNRADKLTWKLWCAWMVVLYLLPFWKDHSILLASRFDQWRIPSYVSGI